jgi:hypothetical protein
MIIISEQVGLANKASAFYVRRTRNATGTPASLTEVCVSFFSPTSEKMSGQY